MKIPKQPIIQDFCIALMAILAIVGITIATLGFMDSASQGKDSCYMCGGVLWEKGWQHKDIWVCDYCEQKLEGWAHEIFNKNQDFDTYNEARMKFIYYMAKGEHDKVDELIEDYKKGGVK